MHYYTVNNDLAFDLPFVCPTKALNILWQKLRSTLGVKKNLWYKKWYGNLFHKFENKNSKYKELQRSIGKYRTKEIDEIYK